MAQGTWYRLLEALLFALPPVIGVGIVGLLQGHPDPLVGRTILTAASVGGLAIRVGVPICLFFDGRELRQRGQWRPNYPLYAIAALVVSAPLVGILYLYRRHERVTVAPGWDGWWVVVAASLGGSLSGIPIALLAYVLALPPAVIAIPATFGALALAALPVGIYRDARYVRNTSAGWRPNPAFYLGIAFFGLLVPLVQPPLAAYYLLRRSGGTRGRSGRMSDKLVADASTVTKRGPAVSAVAMAHTFTEDDEGKSVVNDQGEDVGIIADVEHGTAYVNPDPGVTDKIKSKLGWDDRGEDTYPLQEESVESVTDDEVRLGSATAAGAGTGTSTSDDTAGAGTTAGTTGAAGNADSGVTDDDDDLIGDDDDDGLLDDDDDDGLLDDDDDTRR